MGKKIDHQPGLPPRLVATPLLVGAGLFADYSGLGAALASVFYIAGVHLAVGLPGTRSAIGTALASTLLVMTAGFAAPGPPVSAMLDRLGCILLIAVSTKMSLARKRAFETLARKQEESRESTAEESARLAEVLERLRQEGQKRREAESALRKNQEHFNLAVIGSRDGIWDWFDVERDEEWWSPRFYQLLGYEPGEIDSTLVTFGGMLHPDDKERAFQAVEEHLAGNAEFDIEYRLRTKSGSYRWFHARGRAFRPDARQPIRMSGTITDIHDRKLAEDHVRLANQRFERAVRGTSDGLWEWNVESGEAWYAPRFEELLGYEPDALSRTFTAFTNQLHTDDHDMVMKAIDSHLEKRETFDCEQRLLTKSNEYRWFRVRGAAERDESGRAVLMAGSLQDVTASKLQFLELEHAKQTTEQQARELKLRSVELAHARDAALESARLKSEFLATMSHEIRTPMNGVIGMTGLLLDTDLDPEQRECADAIRHSADSLLGIINDILDFSKIEAGRLAFETLDFDLVETVEGAADLLADQALSKGVELAVLFSPGVPRQLRGDPGRLRQVLVNLIGNAVKFTHEGEVVVRVDPTSEDEHGATIHFAVHDTGIGLSEQQQRLLFEPFVQAEGGATRKYGGTGLGLAISKRLTGMMKGEIGIQSQPGRGSTFWFTAVFGKSTKTAAPFCDLPIPPQQVLVIAPRRIVAEVVEYSVAGSDINVRPVSQVDEAVAILRDESLNSGKWTILLDMSAAPTDLTELTRMLGEPAFVKTHRLVALRSLSAKLPPTLRSLAHLNLTKPLKRSQLIHCLRAAVRDPNDPEDARAWPAHVAKRKRVKRKTRVLVADDNVVNQKVALKMLDRLGYSAEAVANGLEAVAAHRDVGYDLILMDCHMPEMDGFRATQEIRAGLRSPATPIIALTASVLPADRALCAEAGMDDFIKKPVDLDVLSETLDRWEKISRKAARKAKAPPLDENSSEDQGSSAPVTTNMASPGLTTGN